MPVVGNPRRPPNAVIAAASRRTLSTLAPAKPEAADAEILYDLYRRLGQVRYGLQFKANAATKVRYFVGRRTDDDPEPAEEYDDALHRLQGPMGGFPQIVSKAMLDLDIAGEGYLVGRMLDSVEEEWSIYSAPEYRRATQARPPQSQDAAPGLTEDDVAIRLWRPDPEERWLPDSPLRSVRDEAEQYILLRDMVTAITKSRILAGFLKVPDELTFPTTNPNLPPGSDDLMEYLIQIASEAINNGKSAARVAPSLVRGPGDRLAQMEFLTDEREMPEWVATLMERVLRQMAIGLDLPAEILLGLADVNHWGQWLIDDSARLNHADPLILLVLDSITRGYLRPYLEESGVSDPTEYLIWRDFTDLTSRTVTAEDARHAYADGVISEDAYRGVIGFTDQDAPDEDQETSIVDSSDLAARVNAAGILIRSGFTPEASLRAMGLPPIEHTGLLPVTVKEEPQVDPGEGDLEGVPIRTAPAEEPRTGEDAPRQPPALVAAASEISLDALADLDQRLYLQIAEASQAALDRALEKAGARIRSHVTGDRRKYGTLAAQIDGIGNCDVAMTLGREAVARLQLSDDDLIPEGTFATLASRVSKILERGQDETARIVSRFADTTRDATAERSWRDRAVGYLIDALRATALGRLFTPDLSPDPAETGEINDVAVPAGDVWDTLTLAAGGEPGPADISPRGLGNGQQTIDWLQASGFNITRRRWDHGAPQVPFEPHLNLDGTVFDAWTDEQLSTPGYASWLQTPYLYPGDHRGCSCTATLIVESELAEAV